MKLIDIDELFKKEILRMLAEGKSAESLEDEIVDLFLDWLNTPNEALEGVSPNEYFTRMTPEELCGALVEYVESGANLPDPLLDALEDSESEAALLGLLRDVKNEGLNAEMRATVQTAAASLLNQKESKQTAGDYIAILERSGAPKALREAALEGLAARGEEVKEELLQAVARASDESASDDLLSLLAELPHDERIYQALLHCFQSRVEDRSSCAASFARYGDERAIPVLTDALAGAKYREYTAMCEAIEALGGPEQPRRSFAGDPDYEAVRKEKEEQRKKNAGE